MEQKLLLDLQGRDAGGSCCRPLGVGFSSGQEHQRRTSSASWWINIPVESLPDGCGCFSDAATHLPGLALL